MPLLITHDDARPRRAYVAAAGAVAAEVVATHVGQQPGGPYRWLRHPAYAGNLVTYFGLGLAIGSWVGAFAIAAIALVGHIPRIRVEEAELTRALGDQYREYAGTTARLVPRVW